MMTQSHHFSIAIFLACLTLGLAYKVNNIDKTNKVAPKTPDSTAGPSADPNHPALQPGFPYIWPYLHGVQGARGVNSPYFHPYYWPMYLYHGQYAPHIPKEEANKLKEQMPYMETLVFIGKFAGTCKGYPNGLYYIDSRSFAYCSNGIKTVQNCPEGAENPALSEFYKGLYRFVHDFCSVNLLVNKVPLHPQAYLLGIKERKANEKKAH